MYTRQDTLNFRAYAVLLKTAKNSLKTIEKIKKCADYSIQKHGHSHTERPDTEYIFFDIQQLRMVCFDYAFSALENFLEHIGFILFLDWDSKNKQRHYREKQEKLLSFSEIIEKNHQPSLDYETLEHDWNMIIQSINLARYNNKRNPIKHIHSEKHDVKMQTVFSTNIMMNTCEYEQLVNGTLLDLTDNECTEIINETEEFIQSVHSFIQMNKLIFRIYCNNESDKKIEMREKLLETFLMYPLTTTMYSSTLTVATA